MKIKDLINIYLCHTCMVHHKEVNLKRISTCALDLKYITLQVLLIHCLSRYCLVFNFNLFLVFQKMSVDMKALAKIVI